MESVGIRTKSRLDGHGPVGQSFGFTCVLVWAATLMGACTGSDSGRADAAPPSSEARPHPERIATYMGHLVYGHESREFAPCGSQESLWVADGTGGDMPAVYQHLAAQPYAPVFVEVRGTVGPAPDAGFADPYVNQIRVVELLRAARETAGCDEDLSGIVFRALGVEPFWRLDITPDGVELLRLGMDSRRFEVGETTRSDARVRWTVVADKGDSLTVDLVVQRCTDPMSGSVFPYAAHLEMGEGTLRGCAYDGALR